MKQPKDMSHFGLFCLGNILPFHINKQFQNMVCCDILMFEMWFGVNVLHFQVEL
jgi:hypothetical protein